MLLQTAATPPPPPLRCMQAWARRETDERGGGAACKLGKGKETACVCGRTDSTKQVGSSDDGPPRP